jgi:hypothetical protein
MYIHLLFHGVKRDLLRHELETYLGGDTRGHGAQVFPTGLGSRETVLQEERRFGSWPQTGGGEINRDVREADFETISESASKM